MASIVFQPRHTTQGGKWNHVVLPYGTGNFIIWLVLKQPQCNLYVNASLYVCVCVRARVCIQLNLDITFIRIKHASIKLNKSHFLSFTLYSITL